MPTQPKGKKRDASSEMVSITFLKDNLIDKNVG